MRIIWFHARACKWRGHGDWWECAGCQNNGKHESEVAGSLESEDYVALARDWIGLFAVDSEVGIVPEDVWLRG